MMEILHFINKFRILIPFGVFIFCAVRGVLMACKYPPSKHRDMVPGEKINAIIGGATCLWAIVEIILLINR